MKNLWSARFRFGILVVALQALNWTPWAAEKAVPLTTFARLPMKEITVFKDGHAFVAHEGELPTDRHGNVVLDYLPMPVVGTFWPYAAQEGARLRGVVAGQRRVTVEHTALNIRELIEANIGAEAIISEGGTNQFEATILSLPMRSGEELAATSPPNAPERLPERGNLVLLKTSEGVKALNVDQIQQITFKGPNKAAVGCEEFRNLLTMQLDWIGGKPRPSARVGLFYLQRGIRWIPGYKIELDGQGKASVKMQATLINELADLDDISVNLVVGVPSFPFKDTLDPMALQQSIAQLSSYFQSANVNRNSPLAYQFSNAMMTQSVQPAAYNPGASDTGVPDLPGLELGSAGKTEDLFVYNVPHVSLRRGERMVLTVAEFSVPYEDIFSLDLPFAPPPEVRCNLSNEQQRELARLFNAPKVLHKVRLTNQSQYPFTTAPALVLRDGRLLAQTLMTFTSPRASVDLSLTTAVDFQVRKTDKEARRTPDAARENGNSYSRVDLTGTITLTSHRSQPVVLEVTRHVLGTADKADHEGVTEKANVFEDGDAPVEDYPSWWGWYGWPYWWSYFNGMGRITWKVKLEPSQSLGLTYEWHYFWR